MPHHSAIWHVVQMSCVHQVKDSRRSTRGNFVSHWEQNYYRLNCTNECLSGGISQSISIEAVTSHVLPNTTTSLSHASPKTPRHCMSLLRGMTNNTQSLFGWSFMLRIVTTRPWYIRRWANCSFGWSLVAACIQVVSRSAVNERHLALEAHRAERLCIDAYDGYRGSFCVFEERINVAHVTRTWKTSYHDRF